MYSIRSDHPLDVVTQNIVRQFNDACHTLGIDYFLIGATARDIMLTHVFGIGTHRATRDVDFAVAVLDWPTFDRITSWFLARPERWSRSMTTHRLLYRDTSTDARVPMDVVPFGPIEHPPTSIAWPPDMMSIMRVAGFAEAFHAAVHVQVGDDLAVPVASIPGLAVLKLFAWADRHTQVSKDAQDLLMLFRYYADAGNLDRLYNEAFHILESCDYDLSAAGSYLLGVDAATLAGDDTRARMLAFLNNADARDQLIRDMARSAVAQENSLTYVSNMLTQFVNGLSIRPFFGTLH